MFEGSKGTNNMIGDFNIPLTGQEMLFQLSQGVPVQIGRRFLSKALLLLDRYAEADVDVRTDSKNAYLRPSKCELNAAGKAYVANTKPAAAGEG
jgi:hypothetical protein